MMMAFHSGPPSRELSEETIRAVRLALAQFVIDGGETGQLRDALCRMAREARTNDMLPERLLVVLKDVWHALPDVRNAADPREKSRLLQRLVTLCIKEYYSA
jgi:hypothetical protein